METIRNGALNRRCSLIVILMTSVICFCYPKLIVIASVAAFLLSELADYAIYTALQERRLITTILASSLAGLIIDSMVFLYLAVGSLDYLGDQIVGKAWMVLLASLVIWWIRNRDKSLNTQPM